MSSLFRKSRGLLIVIVFILDLVVVPLTKIHSIMIYSAIQIGFMLAIVGLVNHLITNEKLYDHKIILSRPQKVLGVLSLICYLGLYWSNHNLTSILAMPAASAKLVAACFIAALSAGIFEEYFVRGYLFNLIQRILKKCHLKHYTLTVTALITSLIFGALHFVNLSSGAPLANVCQQVFYASCFGLFFAALRIVTNTIYIGAILHFLIDFNLAILDSPSGSDWLSVVVIFSVVGLINLALIILFEKKAMTHKNFLRI